MNRLLRLTSLLALLLLAAGSASAEIAAIKTDPEDGATLTRPVRTLRVWFSEAPNVDESELALTGPRGAMSVEGLHTMGADDLMARVSGGMPNGEYTASYTTRGADGSEVTGEWKFTIDKGGSQSGAGEAMPEEKTQTDDVVDVGVVLYPGWEPLDVFGPIEMFMNVGAERLLVHLIAEEKGLVPSSAGAYPPAIAPKVEATYDFTDAPDLDVILVPGGFGTVQAVMNQPLLDFLAERSPKARYTTSVCSGSAILAKAGLLDGLKATGTKQLFSYVASHGPEAEWIKEARWVEDGNVITSSGVSAGIDMALALIAKLFGDEAATAIANATEYEWHREADEDPFTEFLDAAMPGTSSAQR